MRIRNRSFIIMLSKTLAQASTIALGICLVRMIDQTLFGTYRQMILALTTVSTLLSLQLEDSLFYFVPRTQVDRLRPLLAQTALLGLFTSAVSATVLFFGADTLAAWFDNPEVAGPLRVIALYPLTEKLVVLVPAFMLSRDKAIRAAGYSLAASVGRVIAVITAFLLGGSLMTVATAMVSVSLIITAIAVWDIIRSTTPTSLKPDAALAREQISYCVPLFMTSLVGVVNVQWDKWLISTNFDAAMYGIYSCGAMELPIIGIITASVNAAIMPNLVTLMHEKKPREAINIWQEGTRKCSLIIIPAFAFMISVPVDFMTLLYGPKYGLAALPFAVYLLTLPFRVAMYATLLRAAGRTRPIAVYTIIGLLLNMALSTAFLMLGRGTMWAFVGPSFGAILATGIIVVLLLRKVCAVTGHRASEIMRWNELLRIMGISLAAAIIMLLVPIPLPAALPLTATLAMKLAIRGLLFTVVLSALMWMFKFLHDDEIRLAQAPWRMVKRRLGIGA